MSVGLTSAQFLNWLMFLSFSVKLKAFSKFENTTDALSAVTAIVEGKVSKNLKKFLSDELNEKDLKDKLAVGDAKLGSLSVARTHPRHRSVNSSDILQVAPSPKSSASKSYPTLP